jgi:amidohydrolase
MRRILSALLVAVVTSAHAQSGPPIKELVGQVDADVIKWRRHIHENPELGYQEVKTAAYVAAILRSLPGMEVQTGIAKTGVKAILKGNGPGPVVALRADMDALPVAERNDLPFRSKAFGLVDGKELPLMHACGHDTHVAMLLGAAAVLSKMREQISGTIVFLFQPAEEGGGGAFEMMKAGVLDNPKVEAVFGQHIGAGFPSGSISYRSGGTMASADTFEVKVLGKGGHGSAPWVARDPILAAAQMIVGLQSAIARDVDMSEGGAVLTVGEIAGGTRRNIIPDEVKFAGTIRTLAPSNRDILEKSMDRILKSMAQAYGVDVRIKYERLYPVTHNDPALAAASLSALKRAAGDPNVREVAARMGSEDFGAYTQTIPGFFWFLNASPHKDRAGAPNHSAEFMIDESSLKVGVDAMVNSALDFLHSTHAKR